MYCWAETDMNRVKERGGDFYILLNTEWCVELRTYGCQHIIGTTMGSSSGTLNLKLEETELKLIGGAGVCPNAGFPWSLGDCLGDSLPETFGSTYILPKGGMAHVAVITQRPE